MDIQLIKDKIMGSGKLRIAALSLALLAVAVIIVFAVDYNSDSYQEYEYVAGHPIVYVAEYPINIDVDDEGSITSSLETIDFYIVDDGHGNILLRLPPGTGADNLVITLPYGWSYWFMEEGNCHYCYHGSYDCEYCEAYGIYDAYYDAYAGYCEDDEDIVLILVLSLPAAAGQYSWDYSYNLDYDYNQYCNYAGCDTYIGEGSGYMGIMPFANFSVTFDHNDAGFTDPWDFPYRRTLNDGSVGVGNMPPDPVRPDHIFMGWTRTQDGSGVHTGITSGERFDGNSRVTAGMNPLTVYAQWGFEITFACNYTNLNRPATPNPGLAGNFCPRVVHHIGGKSFAESNALVWTANQVWPNNPANRTAGGNSYFFGGWYTRDSSGNPDRRITADTPITGNITVYPNWLMRRVVFNPQNGDAPEYFYYFPIPGTGTSSIPAGGLPGWPGGLPAPTHPSGYHFHGWTRTPQGLGTATAAGTIEHIWPAWPTFTNANLQVPQTIFGQWSVRISFDGNGAALNMPATPEPNLGTDYNPRYIIVGQTFNMTRSRTWARRGMASNGAANGTTSGINWVNDPVRPGYHFGGWFTKDINNEYYQLFTTDCIATGDKTLYARWISYSDYDGRTVIFNPQNGIPESAFQHVDTIPTGSPGAGSIGSANWPTPDPTRPDHHFMAWTRTQDGSGDIAAHTAIGVLFNENSTVTIGQSPFTVYAQWGHQLTFNLGEFAGASPVTRIYAAGMSANESNAQIWTTAAPWPTVTNLTNLSFAGWYTRVNGEYAQRFDANTVITQDTVLYAKGVARGVYFNPNNGVALPGDFHWAPLTAANAGQILINDMPLDPVHPQGYVFIAWTRTKEGLGTGTANSNRELVTYASTTFALAETPVTVYAQWGHQVTFFGNGLNLAAGATAAGWGPRRILPGTTFAQSNTRTWITAEWPNNPPHRRGFNFVGWFEIGAYDNVMFDANTVFNRCVNLYARWEPLRVYFDPDDGITTPNNFEMRPMGWYGNVGAANMPPNPPPHPDGRHFMNWVRPPSPYGSTQLDLIGLLYYTPFTGTSWIHAVESPLTATARYGWQITFQCEFTSLAPGNTVTGYSPRVVAPGTSLVQTNALHWTVNIVWPNNLANTAEWTFLGWYTKDANNEFYQRVDSNTVIHGNTELHANWRPRGITFIPRDGVTLPQDYEWRPLTAATNATIVGGAAGMPPDPVSPRGDGLHFITWTRTEAGLGTGVGVGTRELVDHTTTFPTGVQAVAFGQWGHHVTFDENGVTLPAGFQSRFVLPGTTFAETNIRTWLTGWPGYPNVTGHTFLGWYTRNSAGYLDQRIFADHVFTSDMRLYARWEVGQVIFETQDGTPFGALERRNVISTGTGIGSVGAANMPANPTRNGFRFMVWTRSSTGVSAPDWTHNANNATGVHFTGTSTITAAQSPFTAYAQWGHQLIFHPNGGSAVAVWNRVVRTGMSAEESRLLFFTATSEWPTNPTLAGHTFMGFYTRNAAGDFDVRVDANTPITPALVVPGSPGEALGDINLYARWIPTAPMSVIFNHNTDDPGAYVVVPTTAAGAVGTANFPSPNPAWGDRVFFTWTRTQDGSGTATGNSSGIVFNTASTITYSQSPYTVYAQWGHTVTFHGNGMNLPNPALLTAAGYGPRVISHNRNVAQHNALIWTVSATVFPRTVVWPGNPTRAGWSFRGWYTRDANGELDQRVDATTPITGSYRLYANWVQLEVIFNPNGGTNAIGVDRSFMGTNGTLGSMPQAPDRSADGMGFIAWTRTQCGNALDPWLNLGPPTSLTLPTNAPALGNTFNQFSTIPHLESPFTVYAQWSFAISFNGGGIYLTTVGTGANQYGNRNIAEGRTVDGHITLGWTPALIWPNNPIRLEYKFLGWGIAAPGNPNVIIGMFCRETTVIYRNILLVAQWQPDVPYRIDFCMCDIYCFGDLGPNVGLLPQMDHRFAWRDTSVNTSSNLNRPIASRQNMDRAWPRSAPNVLFDPLVQPPMTIQGWWTERGGWYGGGELWAPAGWAGANNIHNSATGVDTPSWNRGEGTADTIVNGDITVYPNWVFRVYHHPNGGNAGQAGQTSPQRLRDVPVRRCMDTGVFQGDTIRNAGRNPSAWTTVGGISVPGNIARNHPTVSRSGFVFLGWWSVQMPDNIPLGEEAAFGFPNAYQFTLDTHIYQNRTVWARWIRIEPIPGQSVNPIPRVRVFFDLNDGGRWWAPYQLGVGRYGQRWHELNVGGSVGWNNMPQFPIANPGYIFMGWFLSPDGPDCVLTPRNLLAPNRFLANRAIHENLTVYAHWEPAVTLTFHANGGNPAPRTRLMAIGRNFAEMRQIWADTNALGTSQISGNARPPGFPSGNCFRWAPESTATGSLIQQTTRPGFTQRPPTQFWNRMQDGSGSNFLDVTRVFYDQTVFAQWTLSVIFCNNRINFNNTPSNSGTTLANRTRAVNEGGTMRQFGHSILPSYRNPPGPWNYTDGVIIGWFFNPEGTGPQFDLDTVVTEPITVYAQWQADVFFNRNQAPYQYYPAGGGSPWYTILPENRIRQFGQFPAQLWQGESSVTPGLTGVPLLPVIGCRDTWPGHIFIGWNLIPIPANTTTQNPSVWVNNLTYATRPMTVYAIWQTTLTFDGAGGTFSDDGVHNLYRSHHEREIGRDFGPAGAMPDHMSIVRTGWNVVRHPQFPAEIFWHENRFANRDNVSLASPNEPFRHTSRIWFMKTLWAQWVVDVYFISPGGTVNGQPGYLVNNMPETGTMQQHSPGGMPTAHKPGYNFTHWEVQIYNPATGQYEWRTFTGSTVIGGGITDEPGDDYRFARCPNNPARINVVARFERAHIDVIFYKTDMGIYTDADVDVDFSDVEFLEDAHFHLYRWCEDDNEWIIVSDNIFSSSAGRVTLPNLAVPVQFKLREVLAPVGFATPPVGSHWLIQFCQNTNTLAGFDEFGGTLPFRLLPRRTGAPPVFCDDLDEFVYEYEYHWHVGNRDGLMFDFHKVNRDGFSRDNWQVTINGYLLAGARFRLFRSNVPTAQLSPALSTGSDGLVLLDLNGSPNAPWTEVPLSRDISTANPNTPMYFVITPGFTYQLVEVLAPAGFQVPMGQWRLVYDNTVLGGVNITPIGGVPIPEIRYAPCSCNTAGCEGGRWYVGNWVQFELPLAGGAGIIRFAMAGAAFILAAAGLSAYMVLRKKEVYASRPSQ